MVGLLDFRSHSKSRPFANQLLFEHSKYGHVQISDPHCMLFRLTYLFPLFSLPTVLLLKLRKLWRVFFVTTWSAWSEWSSLKAASTTLPRTTPWRCRCASCQSSSLRSTTSGEWIHMRYENRVLGKVPKIKRQKWPKNSSPLDKSGRFPSVLSFRLFWCSDPA